MPAYSEKVMEHFMNPRNVGDIPDADGIGEEGNPVCGDMMTFYIKVDEQRRLSDVKFKTFGCGAAIAVSSMVSEMAKGKTIEEALKITPELVAKELDGLPKQKFHCSNLGAQALHKAIDDYEARKSGKKREHEPQPVAEMAETAEGPCCCPSCGGEVEPAASYCKPCQVTIRTCPQCRAVLARSATECPECGAKA